MPQLNRGAPFNIYIFLQQGAKNACNE